MLKKIDANHELDLGKAVEYANFHYYSRPLEIPYPGGLTKVSHEEHSFQIRVSHGLLPVIAAMELIPKIYYTYLVSIDGFEQDFKDIAKHYDDVPVDTLLKIVQIAVLFLECGRLGEGQDLWNDISANLCKDYLENYCEIPKKLASMIVAALKFKDENSQFSQEYPGSAYIKEIIIMAYSLEELRASSIFEPEHLPIAKHVKPEDIRDHIIPKLVVPHRQRIINEGRLTKDAVIEYKFKYILKDENPIPTIDALDDFLLMGDLMDHIPEMVNERPKTPQTISGRFSDESYIPKPGQDFQKIAETYAKTCQTYKLSILDINKENMHNVIKKALRGIEDYIKEYQNSPGIRWTHNGFFSPRYHGTEGIKRAMYYQHALMDDTNGDSAKIRILYALLSCNKGQTLKEFVMQRFNQVNENTILQQLSKTMKEMSGDSLTISDHNDYIKSVIASAEEIGPENVFGSP
jgi:hypothetical protein